MSKQPQGVGQRHSHSVTATVKTVQRQHQQQAQQLLDAYQQADPQAIDTFRKRIPEATQPGFKPTLLHARMLVASDRMIPQKLSLEKLKAPLNNAVAHWLYVQF